MKRNYIEKYKIIEAEIYKPFDEHPIPFDRYSTFLYEEIINLFKKDGWKVKKYYVGSKDKRSLTIDNKNTLHDDVIIFRLPYDSGAYIISFQDMPSILPIIAKNQNLKGASITHFTPEWNRIHLPKHHHLITPGYYFPMHPSWIEEYKDIIQPTFEDKRIFFSGTTGTEENFNYQASNGKPRRLVAHIIKEKYPNKIRLLDRNNKLERREWWKEAAKHRINLSLPGHPWCNREFELWGLGLPVLAAQWKNPMINNPIANYHYMAVNGGVQDLNGVSMDAEQLADQIIEYYNLVINDIDFIKSIAKHGQEFYNNHIQIKKAVVDYYNLIHNSRLFENIRL